ncbi:MAG: hypothetical protein UCH28_07565 [Adlercreutzia sp.]|nr:hypothetical protein [Adlercreutzia sp.]
MDNRDFAEAVRAAATIMEKIPNDRVKAAAKAVKNAAPAVGAVAQAAPAVAKAVGPAAKKASHAVAGAAGNAKEKAAEAAVHAKERAADAAQAGKVAVKDKVSSARSRHQEKQARREARRAILSCAPAFVDADDLLSQSGENSALRTASFLDYPGCYAAVTYGKLPKDKELATYREAQVCFSTNMGESMNADLNGSGNPDVYADVKYRQHVRFYLYPCSEEDAIELLPSLLGVLADESSEQAEEDGIDDGDASQKPDGAPTDETSVNPSSGISG